MLRLLARDEYDIARAPVNVVEKLREQLGRANIVHVSAESCFPQELMLDWNLWWHAVCNILSNARKYGDKLKVAIRLAFNEEAGRMTVEVANSVDLAVQAHLLAKHGTDGTHLLHRRADGSTALSSNIGSKVMLTAAQLFDGVVSLHFSRTETRLRLEVAATRPVLHLPVDTSFLLWFLDDDAATRRRYLAWISHPLCYCYVIAM
jgi:signal transduction histidine kinase